MSRLLFSVALIAVLTGCADLDKSLYAVGNGVSSIDRVTGQRSLNLTSRPQQIEKGNQIAQQIINELYIAKNKPINEKLDTVQYDRVKKIVDRIISVSHLSGESWDAYLVPDDDFNAYTTGGTKIVINKGLLDQVKNDDEIAAVLGHEIAHVAANHIFEGQANALAESIKSSKVVKRQSFQSAFTMANEEEADKIGTLYAVLAGYDPYAASSIWKRMYEHEGNFSLFGNDHPMNGKRYEKTKQLGDEYNQYYIPGQINPDHSEILRKAFLVSSPQSLAPGEGGGALAVLAATLDGVNKYYGAKLEEKKQKEQIQRDQIASQSIKPGWRKVTGPHTVAVNMHYTGNTPLSSISMLAKLGDETAVSNIDSPIAPNSVFKIEFEFPKTNLGPLKVWGIQFLVTHAE